MPSLGEEYMYTYNCNIRQGIPTTMLDEIRLQRKEQLIWAMGSAKWISLWRDSNIVLQAANMKQRRIPFPELWLFDILSNIQKEKDSPGLWALGRFYCFPTLKLT